MDRGIPEPGMRAPGYPFFSPHPEEKTPPGIAAGTTLARILYVG